MNQYELPQDEWLNKRGWKTFQEFRITYGYDTPTATDYMKAAQLLRSFRDSDPFANKELVNEDEEDEEELEELEEGSDMMSEDEENESLASTLNDKEEDVSDDEIDEMSEDGAQGSTKGEDEIEEDSKWADSDNSDEWEDASDDNTSQETTENDHDSVETFENNDDFLIDIAREQRERIELGERLYSIRAEYDGIHEWLVSHGWSCLRDYMDHYDMDIRNNNDVQMIGSFIDVDIQRQARDAQNELGEVAGGEGVDDNQESTNEGRAGSHTFISEEAIDDDEIHRTANTVNSDGAGRDEISLGMQETATRIRNSRRIENWLIEQGWTNLYWFMHGHGFDFHDDELLCMVGQHLNAIIDAGNENGLEILESVFRGLTMGHNQAENSNHISQIQEQSGRDDEMTS